MCKCCFEYRRKRYRCIVSGDLLIIIVISTCLNQMIMIRIIMIFVHQIQKESELKIRCWFSGIVGDRDCLLVNMMISQILVLRCYDEHCEVSQQHRLWLKQRWWLWLHCKNMVPILNPIRYFCGYRFLGATWYWTQLWILHHVCVYRWLGVLLFHGIG